MESPTFEDTQFKNYCGHIVEREWEFCPKCGAEVKQPKTKEEQITELQDSLKKKEQEIEQLQQQLKNTSQELDYKTAQLEELNKSKVSFSLAENPKMDKSIGGTDGKLYWEIANPVIRNNDKKS